MNRTDVLTGQVTNRAHQPDMTGNLFPVDREYDVDRCEITGALPAGLRGSFIRNGPNPMFEPLGRYHMFDGDGMLHSVTFEDGDASFRNRWVRSRGIGGRGQTGPSDLSGVERGDELPRSGTGRGRGAGEEPGQHPHRPPRRAVTWRCGKAACPPR